MTQKRILLPLTFAGSAVCWWPAIITPSLNFSRWLLILLVALITCVPTLLQSGRDAIAFIGAATAGSCVGILSGVILWPSPDPIANSYALFAVLIGTAAGAGAALVGGSVAFLAVWIRPVSNGAVRAALWALLALCLAFGPVLFALTKPLIKLRIARNESIAAARFSSLKNAVEQTKASVGEGAPGNICDGQSLQKHYLGPHFNEQDWSRISGNYVEEDGYVYMISCRQQGRYLLEARPKMPVAYGTGVRTFCADESGEVACAQEWNR